jgi:hypothetical protein
MVPIRRTDRSQENRGVSVGFSVQIPRNNREAGTESGLRSAAALRNGGNAVAVRIAPVGSRATRNLAGQLDEKRSTLINFPGRA